MARMTTTAETTHPDRINGTTGPVSGDAETGAEWSTNDTDDRDVAYLKLRKWWTKQSQAAATEESDDTEHTDGNDEVPKPKKPRKGWLRRRGKKRQPRRGPDTTEENDDDTDDDPQTGDTVDRLARFGRAGRKLAIRMLSERGRLELSEAQRADAAAAAEAKFRARRAAIERASSPLVYVLAVGSAVTGQVTGLLVELLHRLHVNWATLANPALTSDYILTASRATAALAAAFAAALLVEGTGLAFASAFKRARVQGRRALVSRIAMWAAAGTACGMNALLHWGSVWAYPTALGSVVALLVFELETQLESFDALQEASARLQRERAEQTLIYRAVKKARGRRVARLMVATLTTEQRQQMVAEAVDPAAVTTAALTQYMQTAARDANRSALVRWWSDWRLRKTDQKFRRRAEKQTKKRSKKQTAEPVERTSPPPAVDQADTAPVQAEQTSTPAAKQTTAAQPKAAGSPVRVVRQADIDAALLADQYPDGLPGRNQIMRDMSWGASKASAAIAAYAELKSA